MVHNFVDQCSGLFIEQTVGLSVYQLNFIRALCDGIHKNFGSEKVKESFPMGTKSNIARIKKSLMERELIEERLDGTFLSDAVFELWFKREISR